MFTEITCAAREVIAKAFTARGAGSHMYLEFGGSGPMQEGEPQHRGNVVGRQLEVWRRGQASHQR